MLPAVPASARSIAGVAEELVAAIEGRSPALPRVRSAVLVVVDGLGALQLRAHAGHARHLTAAMAKKDVASSVFPTTTAAALTSILTGVVPAVHGLLGYRVRMPGTDTILGQLSGWEEAHVDPHGWQAAPTIFERIASAHPAFALGIADYAKSGFSAATLRGATFIAEGNARDRVAHAYEIAATQPGSFVYCYLPEIDKAGHHSGVDSAAWRAALEDTDAALSARVPDGVGVFITADHGMIDVPAHRHIVFDEGDALWDGIRHVAGEPRMLHLYTEDGVDADILAERWRSAVGRAGDVVTCTEAFDGLLFGGAVAPAEEIAARCGDLLVLARGTHAFYDGRLEDQRAQGMIGQHGSLTPEEWLVPALRAGAFSV